MLSPEELKSLSKMSKIRPIFDIVLCWSLIIGSLYLCHLSYYFIPMALIVIATRLHALTIIMHDASHYLISKNKVLNDIISNIFCSFPLQISTEVYRKTHNDHHRFTQTQKDPNYVIMQTENSWHYPKPKEEVKKIMLKDLFLLNIKEHMIILKMWQIIPNFNKASRLEKLLFPAFLIGLLFGVYYYQLWSEFIILQASALFINPFARMRAMSEHVHAPAQGQATVYKLQETPTINANWLERFIISPLNTNRHLEHHLYPSIPYYNLEKAHALIKKTKLYQRHCLYELDGYILGKKTALNELLSTHESKKIAA